MNILEERKKLIAKINKIENPEILERISLIVEDSATLLNENQINEVRERRVEYLKNPEEVISLEEFKSTIKTKYGF
ncbi:hypothetical protein FLGE108171_05970 [Flavobacterium gelidilacus]|uniref:hypothetical protein n=1 Tax=Flavobacterium gelidilacus TaxID=206041 RepID=UPI0004051786|nr:hypothetical protein [Flavobacterium gelidilacus]